MKRFGMIAMAMACSIAFSGAATANDKKEVKICSGSKDGMYYNVAAQIGERMVGAGYSVTRVATGGSVANLRGMMRDTDAPERCDVAIVQNDAVRNFIAGNSDARRRVQRNSALYEEAVHFICNKDFVERHSIKRLPDIRKFADKGNKTNFAIAVGPAGSGVNETWKSVVSADKSYTDIATTTESGLVAVEKIVEGSDAQCMIFTSALNTPLLKKINDNYGEKVILVAFDDKDLDNAKDQNGKPIYEIKEIPAGTYRNIQPSGISCMGSCAVPTAYVNALLVYTNGWAEKYDGLSDLINAKNAANGSIRALVAGKK